MTRQILDSGSSVWFNLGMEGGERASPYPKEASEMTKRQPLLKKMTKRAIRKTVLKRLWK